MRLHRLELSAFVAFPGREVVDFDALGEAGLFLLQGPTGAGKTTLLDAVSFAFYGEVPGAREAARLRSDHAAPETPTEVTLEATLRGRRIRIVRAPEQERPKLRGEGTTTEAHRVRVTAIADDGSERVLATRHDEARSELGDLLGMTCAQFCQVVLLPQGGFARFLHAGSDEREALLRELFDVGRFQSVEAWLRSRKLDAERAAAQATAAVREVVARAEEASGAEAPDEDVDVWLEQQLVLAEASATTASGGRASAAQGRESAATALVTGRELAAAQAAHREAVAALQAWEARRPLRDQAAAELGTARRAAPAGALVAALQQRSENAADAERTAAAAVAEARRLGVEPETDGQLRLGGGSDVADALRAERDRLRATAGAVEALVAREREVEAAERALADLQRRVARHERDAVDRRAEVDAAAAARPRLEAAVATARDAAAALPGLEEAATRAEAAVRAGAARDALAREVARAEAALLGAREATLAAGEAHNALLARRLDGIAAELAGRLAEGEPCSVCGSTAHPSPASAPEGGVVSEPQVRESRAILDERTAARDRAAAALTDKRARLAGEQAVAGGAPVGDLRAAADAAAGALRRAREDAARRTGAERALRELDGEAERKASQLRAAEDAAREARTQLTERSEALARDREELEAARDGAPSVAARLERLCRAADAADTAADALDAAARLVAEADQARARATSAAREAGFRSVDALRPALRDAARIGELEDLVRRWDEGLVQRRAVAEREDLAAAASQPAPDLEALATAASEAAKLAERTHGELVLSRRRHEALTALRGRLADALAVAGPARERHAVAREVADLAAGTSASNRLRMRLSAYVLAARLEEVAAAATVRLQQMSGGRYALEHTDDGAKGRSRGGLDLRVVDAWTGRARSPQSLSGGETFLASLALALGLADVVTAEAGGARLDTLFVDEGFGSLDDEGTLDEVLEVLDGLRDGGRAVGIVSHVAEMRQRIPMQLRVEKGRSGSRVVQGQPLTAA